MSDGAGVVGEVWRTLCAIDPVTLPTLCLCHKALLAWFTVSLSMLTTSSSDIPSRLRNHGFADLVNALCVFRATALVPMEDNISSSLICWASVAGGTGPLDLHLLAGRWLCPG